MARSLNSLDDRVDWLADELLTVKEHINRINEQIEALGKINFHQAGQGEAKPAPGSAEDVVKLPEETWTQVGQEVFLPRLAAVSFMLVFALLLRTVTDNGMLAHVLGSFVGLIYAAALMGVGVILYRVNSRLAPVFPACGILLFYSVLLEGHAKFASLSSVSACLLLLVATIAVGLIGLRYKASTLLFMAVWGSSVAGFAIDFPNPRFFLLGLVVLANNIIGHFANRSGMTKILRWNTLILTVAFWAMLSFKLNFALLQRPSDLPSTSLNFFPLLLFLFWAFYTYTTLWSIRAGRMALEIYHHVLPVITAGGTFFTLYAVVVPWLGGERILGVATVICSALYMGLVAWLVKQPGDAARGKEFVVAAIVLLVQGLSISAPALVALPVMVVAATVLLVRSKHWQSSGTRAIAYFFQGGLILWGIKNGAFAAASTPWGTGMLLCAFWAACALWSYRWCRINPPHSDSGFFYFIDKNDYSAVILLFIGLHQLYAILRFGAYGILSNVLTDYADAFYCSRSIVLNLGVIALMVLGLKLRNKEILITAAVIVLFAAIKVFVFDLFKTAGLPLVLSMLTFGVVAAVSSVVLRKWGQLHTTEAPIRSPI